MLRMNRLVIASLVTLATVLPFNAANAKDSFRLAWSIYVGWMPWDYADKSGIIKKWADKYGIDIEVVQINDYVESINQFTAGEFDACVMTNMDALTIPAASGVDTTALIVGDFSNGNDAVILKQGSNIADLKGKPVNLVELSVSHYLLARGLESVGLSEKDVSVINTSDADMVAAYGTDDVDAVVTWNPLVSEIMSMPNAHKVFDSSQIPGEIIDATMVNTSVLNENPKFAKALAGAWYETMSIMSKNDKAGKDARSMMAEASGTDLAGYDSQLAATKMFYSAADAASFVNSSELVDTMRYVADFSFAHGLLGDGAPDASFIGVAFPNGTVNGDIKNIKLRFSDSYMKQAAKGEL
ncbi:putative urea ABC transporter substrate-binding protein [Oceanobacter mangrovi]|uniref:putative urea ABC transporter substrate-binding protein n=1 Tax=Oceanobacter mangrovi TaxID=2862510 RepID=UPI001C8E28C7|nr:putative urea ABC transporter substrate-binding protein [Oceanobacter mangrovi]